MIIRSVNLETVCGITSRLPENSLPEIAFAGRSNVGKSTLINALMNRKSYARISAQPGKTQTINYYRINDDLYYVDLPGYGYARTSLETRARWGKMIERYFRMSKMLKCIFLLVDIRHEPTADDKQMADWIVRSGFLPYVVATKADKIKRSQLEKQLRMIRSELSLPPGTPVTAFSGETKQGRDVLWDYIEQEILGREKEVPEN